MTQNKSREYRLFGRRQGSPLSPRQQRLIEEVLPQVQIPKSAVFKHTRNLTDLFSGKFTRFHLEIGFGGAEHLIWQAQKTSDVGFIGCEPFINGVVKLLTAIEELNLENIRVCDSDARDLLDVLPTSSLDKVYVLFPDPWPKKRHNKRRFITSKSLKQLARVMKPGAHLCFASDISDYIGWTKDHIAQNEHFEIIDTGPVERPQTRYEQKATRAGRTSVDLTIARIK
jgi:tRNA (guanine-N7-)-methyltransferase